MAREKITSKYTTKTEIYAYRERIAQVVKKSLKETTAQTSQMEIKNGKIMKAGGRRQQTNRNLYLSAHTTEKK